MRATDTVMTIKGNSKGVPKLLVSSSTAALAEKGTNKEERIPAWTKRGAGGVVRFWILGDGEAFDGLGHQAKA